MAYEGFAKLLLNNPSVPKKKILLLKLLLAYFRRSGQPNSQAKLKACLCTFFDNYTSPELSQLAVPLLKIGMHEPNWNMSLRSIAKFFYFHSKKTANQRQLIMCEILDEINADINNYSVNTKWIELLLEFNVQQSDVDCGNSRYSVEVLSELHTKVERLLVCL